MLHHAIVKQKINTIQGWGLFATQLIPGGTVVWERDGPTYTWQEILALPQHRFEAFDQYGFQCGNDSYSLPDDMSREVNHSCDPNTWWAGSDVLSARYDIAEGEEITYDYSSCDVDLVFEMNCECNAPNCRKIITNRDYLNPVWQKIFGQNLPDHVLRAIQKDRNKDID